MPPRAVPPQGSPEAVARAVRFTTILTPLWKAARRWTAAIVLALFPLLFIVDHWFAFPFSPVLPGLVILVLLIVALPFPVVEFRVHRFRRRDVDWQARRAVRALQVSNAALAVAGAWLVVWFAAGL